ncbi:M24 family metallopeptidase [Murimonas intestini]|uniref:Xaa-Pro aminopeptidase n=1 Tax=Murimonas intestini TaxID=1337051 RepID=A0AB73T733_9FIRM|nr:Xaa-Pro peptidase family protein [Murimonas intestini]MCR1841335.1 Xaa-Pro peptidase family protein [Murimonas intestini]MCR1866253.1 Xaa-Pro peptidase family protein [Murimonas intestini]MCR1882630.1 Xaa-Pro peptidase family protein [Murimonas intestini]
MLDKRISEILKEKKLDAILVSDPFNMRYITGFRGGEGYVYLSEQRQVLLTDSRYTTQARDEADGFEIVQVDGTADYIKRLYGFMQEENVKVLGFEDEHLIYVSVKGLQDGCPGVEFAALGGALNRLRIIKNETELKALRQAEHVGDLAFEEILKIIRPGMTELQVAAELEYSMKKNGAVRTSFETIVASGINSAMPHAIPSEKKIESGDFVTMDFGCMIDGYCSDMTRTIVVGKADEKQKEIYNIVLQAQLAALDAVKAGMKGSEVDKVARDIIYSAGYQECFGHGLGHSVGLFIHEDPRLSPKCHEVLEENMIQTVEPGIYVPGFGGVRIEDMIIVKKDGHENLTHSPKELLEV